MANIESHGTLTVGAVTVRRKPALTYPSPARNTTILHIEGTLFTSQSATTPPLPTPPSNRLSQTPEESQRSTAHSSHRHHMTTPLLPLYHPFGTLALSLPDLDPTVFGLPAPVAVFDDPTRRYSNRQRRPAAKVRDTEEPVTSQLQTFTAETPTSEVEVKEKASPRRRRGGGKRKRKEPEDGDATYPAKRPRHPRSSGVASGLSGTRALSREVGSPALSNGTSPAVDGGRGELGEEKKHERRTTRSQGAVTRRGSTASEETATSGSRSSGRTNTAATRVGSSGEPIEAEEPTANGTLKETSAPGIETHKTDSDENRVLERPES